MSDSFHIQAISRFIIINILKILYNAKENVCIRLSCAFACHVRYTIFSSECFIVQNQNEQIEHCQFESELPE